MHKTHFGELMLKGTCNEPRHGLHIDSPSKIATCESRDELAAKVFHIYSALKLGACQSARTTTFCF